jgi:hypothetical protein
VESVLIGAVLGGGLAGAGCLVAHLIATGIKNAKQLSRRPSWPYTVAIAFAIAATAAVRPHATDLWYRLTIDSRADALFVELETSAPLYRTIRQREPTLYNQLRSELIASIKAKDTEEQTIMKVRSHLTAYVGANMHLVPDEVLVRVVDVSVQEARALGKSNPEMCVSLLNGEPIGDIRPFLPDELERAETAAMEELIIAPKSMVRPAMTTEEASQLSLEIILRKSDETGVPFDDFVEVSTGKLEPARACAALVEFMAGITELPPHKAGAMYRSLLSNSAQ